MDTRSQTPSRARLRVLIDLLSGAAFRDICDHAREAAPSECCGFVLASGVRRCENIQDELHRLDPIAYPRTARTAFAFSASDEIFLAESFRTGDPVWAVYHSHPEGEACFSRADRVGVLRGGKPLYPALFYVVVGCHSGHVAGAKVFGIKRGTIRALASFGASLDRLNPPLRPRRRRDTLAVEARQRQRETVPDRPAQSTGEGRVAS